MSTSMTSTTASTTLFQWELSLDETIEKVILQVMGSVGAVWGWSEVLTIRNTKTVWFWRPYSIAIGFLFVIRLVAQNCSVSTATSERSHVQHYDEALFKPLQLSRSISQETDEESQESQDTPHSLQDHPSLQESENDVTFSISSCDDLARFVCKHAATLVLEVFGGAGALWGFSEILTLRTTQTLWFWRPASVAVGAIQFLRWCIKAKEDLYKRRQNDDDDETEDTWSAFVTFVLERLLLEVFGGAGAVWGFTEATFVRTETTTWFWRPMSLVVGGLFFYRYLCEVRDFMATAESRDKGEADALLVYTVEYGTTDA